MQILTKVKQCNIMLDFRSHQSAL